MNSESGSDREDREAHASGASRDGAPQNDRFRRDARRGDGRSSGDRRTGGDRRGGSASRDSRGGHRPNEGWHRDSSGRDDRRGQGGTAWRDGQGARGNDGTRDGGGFRGRGEDGGYRSQRPASSRDRRSNAPGQRYDDRRGPRGDDRGERRREDRRWERRDDSMRDGRRDRRPDRDNWTGRGGRSDSGRPDRERSWERGDDRRPQFRDDRRDGGPRRDRTPEEIDARRAQRAAEPDLDPAIAANMLDGEARRALRTLSKENAETVARHLVSAGVALDVDPELAYQHALAAQRRAGRVDAVREAVATTAYVTGRYAEALREARTVRRLSGEESLRAIEADCERGLGRPEKALAVIGEVNQAEQPVELRVELAIVESGARADLGQFEAGLLAVQNALEFIRDPQLRARLLSVRADRLDDLGRSAEAEQARAEMTELLLSTEETDDAVLYLDDVLDEELELAVELEGGDDAVSEDVGLAPTPPEERETSATAVAPELSEEERFRAEIEAELEEELARAEAHDPEQPEAATADASTAESASVAEDEDSTARIAPDEEDPA